MDKTEQLLQILDTNSNLQSVLDRANKLDLRDWYVGAGVIAQTVWNVMHEFEPEEGIKDYDLVYYDPDTSYEAEDRIIQKGKKLFKDLPVIVEVRNEARVHLWYEKHFGYPINPYSSVEAAIDTWPTTASSVGIRKKGTKYEVYAPFGLDDLLSMIVRANKVQITEEIYQKKVDRWVTVWPRLKVIPWDQS